MDTGRVRAALSLFAEVCDTAKVSAGADARWWTLPVELRVGRMADDALLTLDETETALVDLEAAFSRDRRTGGLHPGRKRDPPRVGAGRRGRPSCRAV